MAERLPGGVTRVTDAADERLSPYRELTDAELRRRRELAEGVFVAEGRLAVAALLASTYPVVSVLLDEAQADNAASLVAAATARGAPVYVAERATVAATVGFDLHRGVVAAGRRRPEADGLALVRAALARAAAPVFCIVEAVNDHENLGALYRNAAAFGVAGVLLDPRCADPFYRRAVRVSLGHVLAVPTGRLEPWPNALDGLRAEGVEVGALTPHAPSSGPVLPLAQWARTCARRPVAVLVGAEGPGLTPEAVVGADAAVTIEMTAGVDSLNVATAAALAFYELDRHRHAP